MTNQTEPTKQLTGSLFEPGSDASEPISRELIEKMPTVFSLTALIVGMNLSMFFAFTAFAWFFNPGSRVAGYADLLRWHVTISGTVTSLLGVIAYSRAAAPVASVRRALLEGKKVSELSVPEVRKALTVFRPHAFVAAILWILPSFGWLGVLYGAGAPGALEFGWPLALAGIAVGLIAGCATAATGFLMTHFRIAPVLLAGGDIEWLKPIRQIRVWHQIVLVIGVLGVLQPVVTTALMSQGALTYGSVLYLSALLAAVVVVVLYASLVALSGTSGNLASQMAKVRRGDFSAAAKVHNLDTFGQLASDFNSMVAGLRQREHIKETFGRYVSQQIADEILAGNVDLGGQLGIATVLFSDIRGFTKMSEQMRPHEVVRFLNSYLNRMVECVFAHNGVPDKFIGDAVMAVWGVPFGGGDAATDARAAVACACDMNRALAELNELRKSEEKPAISIGIGVHTGPLVAGNIGSEQFMQYTVIGDTVNLTSRIEGMTKQLQERIVISEQTAALLGDEFVLEEISEMDVRGREGAVKVFGVRQS